MIKVENVKVFNFEGAIRGLRNPMNSWDKSDSVKCYLNSHCPSICKNNLCGLCVGNNDLTLMKKLYKAGTEHRKYLRQIFVSMDIVAPLYWWKEMDTYKVGTVSNSCSTMHKIAAKEFELDDFSHEHLKPYAEHCLIETIKVLNDYRMAYHVALDDKKEAWWNMIQLLPSSYNQKRTVTFTYENVVTMIRQRTGHKLDEWNDFVALLHGLPYVAEIIDE